MLSRNSLYPSGLPSLSDAGSAAVLPGAGTATTRSHRPRFGPGFLCLLVALLASLAALPTWADQTTETKGIIQSYMEELGFNQRLTLGTTKIAAVTYLPEFYQRLDYEPAWKDERNIRDLFTLIDRAEEHGLKPEDYRRSGLRDLYQALGPQPSPEALARLDIQLTDALIKLSCHLAFGKVDPGRLMPHWNFPRNFSDAEPMIMMLQALKDRTLPQFIAGFTPNLELYRELQKSLAEHRRIERAGGWPKIPDGPKLTLGSQDPRVKPLRERLVISGDMAPTKGGEPQKFDAKVEAGVKSFQHRHGLETDAGVGAKTLAALTVPVQQRIDQIRVNLERIRWVARDLPADFVLVDISGFHVYLYRDNQIIWDARAQVGTPFRQTPTLRANMSVVEFNPTWTVPPTVLKEDYLPKLRQNPNFLREKGLSLLGRDGHALSPDGVDWSGVSASRFPYILRQDPGPRNALGRVKFLFPNPYSVYLHDTPNRHLFSKTERAFSSGCIRIDKPLQLAELLLDDPKRWGPERIQQVLGAQTTKSVSLTKPIPVLVLYWTAQVDSKGQIVFRNDMYGRDQPLLAALDGNATSATSPSKHSLAWQAH